VNSPSINGMQGVRGSNPLSSTTGRAIIRPFGVGLDSPIPDSSGEISERDVTCSAKTNRSTCGAIPQVPATFAGRVTRFLTQIRW
jgi:hypothetical protein